MPQIIAHGIDLVDCERIDRLLREHGERFLERVFTAREIEYCTRRRNRAVHLAGRFAVKEAVFKVLGAGWRGRLRWTDIETLPDPLGRPVVTLHGAARELARALGISELLVSISHTRQLAVASVVAVGPGRSAAAGG